MPLPERDCIAGGAAHGPGPQMANLRMAPCPSGSSRGTCTPGAWTACCPAQWGWPGTPHLRHRTKGGHTAASLTAVALTAPLTPEALASAISLPMYLALSADFVCLLMLPTLVYTFLSDVFHLGHNATRAQHTGNTHTYLCAPCPFAGRVFFLRTPGPTASRGAMAARSSASIADGRRTQLTQNGDGRGSTMN